jgi:hypothetical protein
MQILIYVYGRGEHWYPAWKDVPTQIDRRIIFKNEQDWETHPSGSFANNKDDVDHLQPHYPGYHPGSSAQKEWIYSITIHSPKPCLARLV